MQRKFGHTLAQRALLAFYIAAVVFPVASMLIRAPADDSSLYLAGRGCGLVGLSMLLLLVPMGTRSRFLDRLYGLDVVLKFHRSTAIVAVAFLLLHPFFLAWDAAGIDGLGRDAPWPIRLGQVGLAVAVAAAASAAFCRFIGLDYRWWRLMHKGAYLAPILGIAHAWRAGTSFASAPEIRIHAAALAVLAAASVFWRYAVAWRCTRKFRIAAVRREAVDITRLTLIADDSRSFSHMPGQFAFFSIRTPGFPPEEHPFTIASAPQAAGATMTLEIAAKALGDYTQRLPEAQNGWTILVDGAYGRFSFLAHEPPALLFIAGGVGITPCMSMLRFWRMQNDERPALLIYGNRSMENILFREELAAMMPPLRLVHVLQNAPEGWNGERGYITADLIRRHAGDLLPIAHAYVCGPPMMMAKTRAALGTLGMPATRIHWERFAL